jgi:hypothetical protein
MPVVAALVVGAIVGSVLVGGPFRGSDPGAVSAAAVVRGVRGASPSIVEFDATYAIVERGFSAEIPERRMRMRVAFLAPQRFRLDLVDDTVYPPGPSVPADATVIEQAGAVAVTAPTGCPPGTPGEGCPTVRTTDSSRLADLIVPMATFGSAAGLRIGGTDLDGDRSVVRVSLSFARAAPMFGFLEVGGWRPFFPGDRVDVLLDTETWIPRRLTVTPVDTAARRAWELRFGLPPEHADAPPILDVRAVTVLTEAPSTSWFEVPDAPDRLTVGEVAATTGFRPAVPASTGSLELATATVRPGRGGGSLLVFADGLAYLRVGESIGVHDPRLGCAATGRAVVTTAGVGTYAAADGRHGRCLALPGDRTTVVLESNLPRAELFEVAASLPLAGRDA